MIKNLLLILFLSLNVMELQGETLGNEFILASKLLNNIAEHPDVIQFSTAENEPSVTSITFYSKKDKKPDVYISSGKTGRLGNVWVIRSKPLKPTIGGERAYYFDAKTLNYLGYVQYR